MLAESTLTSKGQLTIPKIVRERLKLKPGSKVIFLIEGDRVEISSAEKNILDWYGAIQVNEMQDLNKIRALVHAQRSQEIASAANRD